MPEFQVDLGLHRKGPIFTNPTARVARFLIEAKEDVGNETVRLIKQRLGAVLRNPTGYYESQIQNDRKSNDFFVTDNNVVYGSWLEGTSSRNKTTRFKGYRTFRLTKQEIERNMPKLLRPHVQRLIKDLGG